MPSLSKTFDDLSLADDLAIVVTARKGVQLGIFYRFSNSVNMHEKQLAEMLHIDPRTIKRYTEHNISLSPVKSEHLLRLIKLFTYGEEIFGTFSGFNHWLNRSFFSKDVRLRELLYTPGGIKLVTNYITGLAHGYPN